MRRFLFTLSIMVFLASFTGAQKYRKIQNDVFKKGEHIEYLVHYGLINAGVATVDVSPKYYILNNRICYRIDVKGETTGAAGLLAKVNDQWRTYIDTTAFVPHRFYRNLEEGNYRRKELTDFDPLTNKAVMKYEQYNIKEKGNVKKKRETKEFSVPDYVQDIISGYYFLRTIKFDDLKEGEVINIPGVMEDDLYDLKIRYKGKEVTKTKFGKLNAHRLVPIMPENSMFSGESSVRFWVSDDKNRVPVRIEADMFIGKIVVEIKEYKNLKHELNFTK